MEISIYLLIVLSVVSAIYLGIVLKRDMQMMQQNSYMNKRYFKWLRMSNDASSVSRLITLLAVSIPIGFYYYWAFILSSVILLIQSVLELRKKYKKPVVFTKRVWRLYIRCWVAVIAIKIAAGLVNWQFIPFVLMALTILSWVVVLNVNNALSPVERSINQGFINDAKRRLEAMEGSMTVIGVTGSYGKTSTKHYLNRILSEKYNVLMTPGSFNTPMGVTRTIREMMQPYNDVFICEMGAKNIGDIKEICDIVHPTIGIVTAVGAQHLESFKSIENVQRTKFELVDALPSQNGFAVINNDFEYVANRPVSNVAHVRYGVSNTKNTDYHAEDIAYSANGTTFTVVDNNGNRLELQTKLVGECNISNLLAAVIVALRLDVPAEKIRYAVSKIEQVEHRLNMKRTPGGVTIIDDAFNSNPDGSRMALNVLAMMNKNGGKRIVITPGMIELGEKQYDYNKAFGAHIADCADVAFVVGAYNHDAILEGLSENNRDGRVKVIAVESFAEAQRLLPAEVRSGDTVLYENDLPDTFK